MGDKRMSIRTLPDGYKVRHYPPDEAHPEGMMVIAPDQSPLSDRLDARVAEDKHRQDQLRLDIQARITTKKVAQQAAGLPPEKSHV